MASMAPYKAGMMDDGAGQLCLVNCGVQTCPVLGHPLHSTTFSLVTGWDEPINDGGRTGSQGKNQA